MKVIAITGSTGGMGQNLCSRLAERGDVALALCSNQAQHLQEQVKLLEETCNVPVYGAAFDIYEEEPVADFFNAVEERFGKVDVLFNLAGLSIPTKMESVKGEEFDRIYNIPGLRYLFRDNITKFGMAAVVSYSLQQKCRNCDFITEQRIEYGYNTITKEKQGGQQDVCNRYQQIQFP